MKLAKLLVVLPILFCGAASAKTEIKQGFSWMFTEVDFGLKGAEHTGVVYIRKDWVSEPLTIKLKKHCTTSPECVGQANIIDSLTRTLSASEKTHILDVLKNLEQQQKVVDVMNVQPANTIGTYSVDISSSGGTPAKVLMTFGK